MNDGEHESLESPLRSVRILRERLWNDPHRPRYHLLPPDGFFNDSNGTIFWKGRYHVFYLGRLPNPNLGESSEYDWLPVWDHSSSRDLVHWIHHPPAIVPTFDGKTPLGIYSGDAVENAPVPTLIYHVPEQGTCIATSEDDDLTSWTPLKANPVIPVPDDPSKCEYIVSDPCAWYEDGVYYALIGNKNAKPGYEGDCTSLFRSGDLVHWEYVHPFYRSDRRWTDKIEDCACPDFFPLADRHMLLMHVHQPYGHCQYYLGRYENRSFYPEDHGRMGWPGGSLSAPETLLDDKGRRIFFGWIGEPDRLVGNRPWDDCFATGWGSVMSLPRIISLDDAGKLRIEPVPELEILRRNHRGWEAFELSETHDEILPHVGGDCLEILVALDPVNATQVGVKVRCSPGGEEETVITYEVAKRLNVAAKNESGESFQEAPFCLAAGELLELRIFLDRSVLEVFANRCQCVTHRTFPKRKDSLGVRIFSQGAPVSVRSIDIWDIDHVCF